MKELNNIFDLVSTLSTLTLTRSPASLFSSTHLTSPPPHPFTSSPSPTLHLAMQAANSRRAPSRSRTDENAIPTGTTNGLRQKPSLSSLGPAQKVAQPQGKKAVPAGTKAGAKRAFGGVVTANGGLKEESMDDVKKPRQSHSLSTTFCSLADTTVKGAKAAPVEARAPLQSRINNAPHVPARVIAPVPHRAKPHVLDASVPMSDDLSEMDVDTKRPRDVPSTVEEEESLEDVSDEEEEDEDEDDWLRMSEEAAVAAEQELAMVRSAFKDDVDMFDTTMVAEYADEIFAHMERLEESVMPNPRYMDFQTEIEW